MAGLVPAIHVFIRCTRRQDDLSYWARNAGPNV